jgi:hypothetical protein
VPSDACDRRAGRGPGRTPLLATVAGGVALVLAFRVLYLIRFGGDPCPMNDLALAEAKAAHFGYAAEFGGMPLVPALLLAARSAGASATAAVGAIYLVAHLLLAWSVLALGRGVLSFDARSRAALAIATAALPAFALEPGFRSLSCVLGAGLLGAAAALLLAPPAPGRRAVRMAGALALAAGAACCRLESLLGVALMALALAVRGRRLGSGRAGAAVAAAGIALGVLFTAAWNHRLAPGHARAPGTYAFYSFYVQSPLLLRAWELLHHPDAAMDEYGRYALSARLLGGFDENNGSVARALAGHPWTAAVWLLLKPVDFAARVVEPDSFTPLALIALFLALRRARREGLSRSARAWSPLLCAFGAPLALLLATADQVHHLLTAAPLLLLAALWGLEPWLRRARAPALRRLGWAVAASGIGAVLLLGHMDRSVSRPVAETARWLEGHCSPGGCLLNALPLPLDALAWADLQAGARLPEKVTRSEPFVFRRYPRSFLEGVRLDRRLADARGGGWRGPTLYVQVNVPAYSPELEPEHWLEGEPDLSSAPVLATFRDGGIQVQVFDLEPVAASSSRGARPTPPAGRAPAARGESGGRAASGIGRGP